MWLAILKIHKRDFLIVLDFIFFLFPSRLDVKISTLKSLYYKKTPLLNIIWVLGPVVPIRPGSMPSLLGPGWLLHNPYCLAGKLSNKSAILLLFICILHWFFFLPPRRSFVKTCSASGDLRICISFSAQDWQRIQRKMVASFDTLI